MRTPRSTPKQNGEPDPLRKQLLNAAARVFAREGYEGTRIMDIVREAGLSTGAVYGRFRSKNDLLREAIIRSTAALHLGPEGAVRVAELLKTGATLEKGALSDSEAVRLEAYVTARRVPEVAAALAEAHERWHESATPLVEAALAEGSLRPDIDRESVLTLFRVIYLGTLLHRGSGLPGPDPKQWEALLTQVVDSLGHNS